MASKVKDPAAIEHAKTLTNIPWCEDYEKMISGMLYNSQAPELVEGRFRARKLIHKYNTYFPDDATNDTLVAEREKILNEALGKIGSNPFIETPFNIDYGCNTSIGDNFYANFKYVNPLASTHHFAGRG
ncbi:putative sugar O-acetyltransferase [Trichoderma sp. SZMC 28014]